ncbi:MAG: DUF2436 domain-containing protein [Bacteroidales bacterium]|jgi:hypothetical protein|nr:DUF2436 domain-containing protein [Bacteroidales bacterium]
MKKILSIALATILGGCVLFAGVSTPQTMLPSNQVVSKKSQEYKKFPAVVQKKLATKTAVANEAFKVRTSTNTAPNGTSKRLKLKSVTPSKDADSATISLVAGDVWGDNTGYILLIGDFDDAITYDDVFNNAYKIPENATSNPVTTPIVFEDSLSINIPGGTYDFWVLNPEPSSNKFWTPAYGAPIGEDYNFKNGWSYVFEASIIEDEGRDNISLTIYDENGDIATFPDLTIYEIMLPTSLSGCDFAASTTIGFLVANEGDGDASSFEINYSIEGTTGSETFNEPILAGEYVEVYITNPVDFSPSGIYNVSATVISSEEENTENNSATAVASSVHLEVPISNHLLDAGEDAQFHFTEGTWLRLNIPILGFNDFTALVDGAVLYTNCIDLDPGTYSLTFGYFAQREYTEEGDIFEVRVGRSGTDLTAGTLLFEYLGGGTEGYEDHTTSFTIDEAGSYQIAFISIFLEGLGINSLELSQIAGIQALKNAEAEIDVYCSDNVLNVKSAQAINDVIISDIRGGIVFKSATKLNTNNYSVNVGNLAKGVYLARTTTAKDAKTVKFIVK